MLYTYKRSECATFRKTKEQYGGLSNMADGCPIVIGPHTFRSSEHLYQALKYPTNPTAQLEIITPVSPMAAKMVAKKYVDFEHPKWTYLKIEVMRWCINLKLIQNPIIFGDLLKSTGDMEIVEDSHKDAFWGAIPQKNDNDTLIGLNVLGLLLWCVRKDYLLKGIEGIERKPRLITELFFDNQNIVELFIDSMKL